MPHDVEDPSPLIRSCLSDQRIFDVALAVQVLHRDAGYLKAMEVAHYTHIRTAMLKATTLDRFLLPFGGAARLSHERFGGWMGVRNGAITEDGSDDLALLLFISGILENGLEPRVAFGDLPPMTIAHDLASDITLESALANTGYDESWVARQRLQRFCAEIAQDRRSPLLAPAVASLAAIDIWLIRSLYPDDTVPSFSQVLTGTDVTLGLLAIASNNPYSSHQTRKAWQVDFHRYAAASTSVGSRDFAEGCSRGTRPFLNQLATVLSRPVPAELSLG